MPRYLRVKQERVQADSRRRLLGTFLNQPLEYFREKVRTMCHKLLVPTCVMQTSTEETDYAI